MLEIDCTLQKAMDQWVPGSHIPGPLIAASPPQQLFRGDDFAQQKEPELGRQTTLLWFLYCN